MHTITHLNPDYIADIVIGLEIGDLIVLVCTGYTEQDNEYLTRDPRPFTLLSAPQGAIAEKQ
jgi:hypothetical protein